MRLRKSYAVAGAVALALTATACTSDESEPAAGERTTTTAAGTDATDAPDAPAADTVIYPIDEWERSTPAEAGLDPAPLEELTTFLGEQKSDCMVVVKDGEVVAESYWNDFDADTDREVFSASKSVTSTLVGIAQDEGFLSIDEPASKYITEWQGTESESVTIKNLLSNDSGRYWDYVSDYQKLAGGENDKTAYAIGLDQQHPPGEHWEYNNSAIQTLEAVLERATGQDVEEFAQEHLFEPIGMESTISKDGAGNPMMFMGVQAGCLDMARFGYLFLRDGMWADEEVLPSEWVAEATSPSQELNPGYGYLWWLNSDGEGATAGTFAPEIKGAPDDAYAALGLFDQIVLVLPEQDMVVVRLGGQGTPEADQRTILEAMAGLTMEAYGEE